MDKRNSCIFVTYDNNLKSFLKEMDVDDILYGMHPKTNKLFWVYERNDKLNSALDIWFKK